MKQAWKCRVRYCHVHRSEELNKPIKKIFDERRVSTRAFGDARDRGCLCVPRKIAQTRSSHDSSDREIDQTSSWHTVTSLGPPIEHPASAGTYSIERFELHMVERGHIHHGALEQNRSGLAGHPGCFALVSRGMDYYRYYYCADYRSPHW